MSSKEGVLDSIANIGSFLNTQPVVFRPISPNCVRGSEFYDSVRSQLRAVWAGETSEECLVAANPSVNEGGHRGGEAETGSWQKLKGELIRSGSAWNILGYATSIERQVCGLNS